VRGDTHDPIWVRPSLLGLLVATGVLYIWGLGASGYANSFYSAAVQAGSHSWTAFFFGSSDSSNFITVDKTPASLWVMDISARIFGVNAWSILVPQALEGVAAVGILYAAVRRRSTPAAGLFAGAVLALTPVAALMFRFNNPDALLTLLLVVAAYATLRALEAGRTAWLVLAGSAVGFAFLSKMLQALIVVPVLGLVYLVCAPTPMRKRFVQLLAAGGALIASAGWWVAIVALIPASSRPYIGGSQHNSILELTLGYNGFGRLTGNETGSVGGGPAGQTGRWGPTGLLRMFNNSFGGQVSWLIPAALVFLVAGLWLTRRAPRTDLRRAALLIWGGWLLLTGIVFSLAKGIIHEYYAVALAPAIGALVGMGAVMLWRARSNWVARGALAVAMAVTAVWATVLLDRTPTWHPGLRTFILVVGLIAAMGILMADQLDRLHKRLALVAAVAAVVTGLAGPTAYTLATVTTAHSGAIPTAGPPVAGARGGPGGRPIGGQFAPGGAPPGQGNAVGPPNGGGQRGGGQRGGLGGLLDAGTPSTALVQLLTQNASAYTWVAAAVGSNSAAGVQLATNKPVMAIGGFNGSDPTPTLAEFQQYVAQGKIHYFISGGVGVGGGRGGPGVSNASSAISSWVQQTFTAATVGGVTVYDLTQTGSSSATG
jgi:4-amino-4-deoxy-L-arabinose transferase-like glycosyltransferase